MKKIKGKMKIHHLHWSLFVFSAVIAGCAFVFFSSPREGQALALTDLLFTPYGGKVEYWTPQSPDPGCSAITAAISVATLGSVNITFEELKIGNPRPASVGIVKINGQKIPGLPHVYDYGLYQLPSYYTLGNSLDICNVCKKKAFSKVPLVKDVCSASGLNKIVEKACGAATSACSPLTNLLYSIGTGQTPSL